MAGVRQEGQAAGEDAADDLGEEDDGGDAQGQGQDALAAGSAVAKGGYGQCGFLMRPVATSL